MKIVHLSQLLKGLSSIAMFFFKFRTSVFCNPAGTSSIYRRIAQRETKDSKTRGTNSLTQIDYQVQ